MSNKNDTTIPKVVVHIDMDCFYVQVERKLCSSLCNRPVAVVQYNPFGDLSTLTASDNRVVDNNGSIIAVSYEARAAGVTRNMRGIEARNKCSDIVLVQVPVSHGKADINIYREAGDKVVDVLSRRWKCPLEKASIDEVYMDITEPITSMYSDIDFATSILPYVKDNNLLLIAGDDKREVQLDKRSMRKNTYSNEVNSIVRDDSILLQEDNNSNANSIDFDSLNDHRDDESLVGCKNEDEEKDDYFSDNSDSRLSFIIDNISSECESNTKLNPSLGNSISSQNPVADGMSMSQPLSQDYVREWGSRPIDQWTKEEKYVVYGAYITHMLRLDVLNELGFTCSAGIAHNKILAKLASAMHKPNKQTLFPSCFIPNIMSKLPLSRLKGFGGKLGESLKREYGVTIATDLLNIDAKSILKTYSNEQYKWMIDMVNGRVDEPVVARHIPTIISCGKVYRGLNTISYKCVLSHFSNMASDISPPVSIENHSGVVPPKSFDAYVTPLCEELCERLEALNTKHNVFSKQFGVHLSLEVENISTKSNETLSISRHDTMPSIPTPANILHLTMTLIKRIIDGNMKLSNATTNTAIMTKWTITTLYLHASNFEKRASEKQNIKSFFKSAVSASSTSNANQSDVSSTSTTKDIKPNKRPFNDVSTVTTSATNNNMSSNNISFSYEEIDSEVFNSLPEDLQNEISQHFGNINSSASLRSAVNQDTISRKTIKTIKPTIEKSTTKNPLKKECPKSGTISSYFMKKDKIL